MELAKNLADRLKAETSALHDRAEGHAFQQAFAGGKLPQATYVRYLEQMHLVYAALEAEISRARPSVAALASLVTDRNFRAPDLAADLAHFGVGDAPVAPLPATQETIDDIRAAAAADPASLVGYHYVLEGSNNGSKFIARNIRRAYGLTDAGVRYLDPYGEDQRAVWAVYKQALGELDVPTDTADAIVRAAQAMFNGVAAVSAALHEPAPA